MGADKGKGTAEWGGWKGIAAKQRRRDFVVTAASVFRAV
jgi:hypothetical protein